MNMKNAMSDIGLRRGVCIDTTEARSPARVAWLGDIEDLAAATEFRIGVVIIRLDADGHWRLIDRGKTLDQPFFEEQGNALRAARQLLKGIEAGNT
jgi:hypothetical protein